MHLIELALAAVAEAGRSAWPRHHPPVPCVAMLPGRAVRAACFLCAANVLRLFVFSTRL